MVVTCGDIPEGDKDAIVGGVLAKGGLYNSRMTHMVTHLVDLTTDSDKARLAIAKKLNARIVLPHWYVRRPTVGLPFGSDKLLLGSMTALNLADGSTNARIPFPILKSSVQAPMRQFVQSTIEILSVRLHRNRLVYPT